MPLDTIGEHCRKSSPKITTLLPKNKFGHYMMSYKVRSIASAQCRCCVGTSSQTISFASRSNLIKLFCTSIEHIESLLMVIGILKIEYEVRSLSNRRATMLEEATPIATCLSRQTDSNNTLYTKVLTDPLEPSRKNTAPSPWAIVLNTVVTTIS
jgi:hypothetical protein